MAECVLVLGGHASGKSVYAESLFADEGKAVYLATFDARADDEEMRARIREHQARRSPQKWRLIEAPRQLPEALKEAAKGDAPILLDSVSIWLANLRLTDVDDFEAAAGRLLSSVVAFSAEETKGRLVIVADECGLGIVAPDPVARRFAEFSGILNRRLAAAAAKAVLVVGGLPMPLK